MLASTNHFASAFKNNCLVRPRKPDTQLPITDLESSINYDSAATAQQLHQQDKDTVFLKEQNYEGVESRNETKHDSIKQQRKSKRQIYEISDLPNLLQSDDKFYKHLQELRHENKKTLKMLEKFYRPVTQADLDRKSQVKSSDFIERMKYDEKNESNSKFVSSMYDSITNEHKEDEYGDRRDAENGYFGYSEDYDRSSHASVDYGGI